MAIHANPTATRTSKGGSPDAFVGDAVWGSFVAGMVVIVVVVALFVGEVPTGPMSA